jgi:hypothetical protein
MACFWPSLNGNIDSIKILPLAVFVEFVIVKLILK